MKTKAVNITLFDCDRYNKNKWDLTVLEITVNNKTSSLLTITGNRVDEILFWHCVKRVCQKLML